MTGIEAAGDAVTGAIIGRAVEPGHGEGGGDACGACANCGTVLQGGFCHQCGQNAHLHRSIGGIGHEIAHGVFHFEGKVWRTLPMLAFKPGQLTRRYIHGERARFVSPMALFLFAVFLTFAVFETVGGPIRGSGDSINFNMAGELAKARTDLANMEASDVPADPKAARKREARIRELRSDIDGMSKATGYMTGKGTTSDLSRDFQIDTGSVEADSRLREALKNPKLLLYKLQSSAYKFAWALIVLSLPFMWLVFALRRDVRIYDHAIFVTYSLSAVMLLLVAMAFVALTGINTGWMLLLFPIHLFVQLKGAYGLSKAGAAWRTIALLFAALIVLLSFAILLLVLGLLN